MAESPTSQRPLERLPIKLIMPNQGRERRVLGGGSAPEPFFKVDEDFCDSLNVQVQSIQRALEPKLEETKIAPVRVQLIPKAIAKSHRPRNALFEKNMSYYWCRFVGRVVCQSDKCRTPTLISTLLRTMRSPQMLKELSSV